MALNAATVDIEMIVTERPLMLDLLHENCVFNSHRRNESVYHQYQQQNIPALEGTTIIHSSVQSSTTHSNIPDKPPNLPSIHALTWGNEDDLHRIFRSINATTSTPELLVHDGDRDRDILVEQDQQASALQSRLFDFVVLADVIFPSNRDCWVDLADTLATIISSCITMSPTSFSSQPQQPSLSSSSQPQPPLSFSSQPQPTPSSLISSSDDITIHIPPSSIPTSFLVGWLAYEPREDWVLVEFSSLLSDRGMHLHRYVFLPPHSPPIQRYQDHSKYITTTSD